MAIIIEMPKLSDTMTVGTLINWLKKEGDPVASGDIIAEVETDKATMEMEVFDDGTLLKQLVEPGAQVEIGTPIAVIGEKGEEIDPALLKGKDSTPAEPAKEENAAKEEKPAPAQKVYPKQPERDEPAAAKPETAPADDDKRIRISPLARKLAEELGVDFKEISGSGPAGRIIKKDILAAAEAGPATKQKPAADAPPPVPTAISGGAPIAEEKAIPVSNMRATIARRLLESKTQIPHYYLEIDVDAAPLMALRKQVNAALEKLTPEQGGQRLSVNDFILKACAEALRRVPAANSSWMGDTIQQHASADVAFAVAIPEGLITPVIRGAHNKTVRQIAAEVRSLAWKARNNKLKPEEFTGGTFTVSNLGMFGIDRFSAIINPPNAAILAVGATRKTPVVKGDEIVVGQRMALTLSGDHRVVDGAVGAEFLAALRELLEAPALALV